MLVIVVVVVALMLEISLTYVAHYACEVLRLTAFSTICCASNAMRSVTSK